MNVMNSPLDLDLNVNFFTPDNTLLDETIC